MPDAARNGPNGGALLRVQDLHAWYGESHILHGMDFVVEEGEVVTLLGRNGAGKTTTLRAIMGIVPQRRGAIAFGGTELVDLMRISGHAPGPRPAGTRPVPRPRRRSLRARRIDAG